VAVSGNAEMNIGTGGHPSRVVLAMAATDYRSERPIH
jgi:hypothetical protein